MVADRCERRQTIHMSQRGVAPYADAVDDVLFQYRVGNDGKPEKDEFSHLADCLMYIVLKTIMITKGITSERL